MIVVRARAQSCVVTSERRCVVVDRRCRESEGKAKIEGYMSVSDEEAHHRLLQSKSAGTMLVLWMTKPA